MAQLTVSDSARTRRYILGCLAALLTLIGASELFLRFGLGLGNPVLIAPDQACAYIVRPNQNIYRFFCHTRINHFGMRSDDLLPAPRPGTLRLMFVGDSITFGTSRVDQSQLFTEDLHRDLPQILHRPVEVLNASASGWAIENELGYIRSRGIFQSDIVFMVLNDADLSQPPATLADADDELFEKRPVSALGELYTRYVARLFSPAGRRAGAGDAVAPDSNEVIRSNMADLAAAHKLVADAGARMVIVYAPFRIDIPNDSVGPESILRSWSEAYHVPFLDLTSAEFSYPSSAITLDNGVHLSPTGHRVAAQAIEKLWPDAVGR